MPSEQKNNRKWPLVVVLCALLLVPLVIVILLFLKNDNNENAEGNAIGYENTAVAVTDQDEFQKLIDGMIEQTKDGSMTLEYKNTAVSADGKNFSCHLANPLENPYDMYIGLYMDSALTDELLLTKLIPPGSGLETFETSRALESGTYNTILVFTRVEEDHQTIKDQVSVTYTLTVQ